MTNRVLPNIESNQIAVDLFFPAAGQLGLVVRLRWDHIEPVSPHCNRPRILRCDGESFGNPASRNINHCDLVLRGKSDIGLFVIGKGNPDKLVEAGRLCFRIEFLDRRDYMKVGGTVRNVVDYTDRIGDMIRDPDLLPSGLIAILTGSIPTSIRSTILRDSTSMMSTIS